MILERLGADGSTEFAGKTLSERDGAFEFPHVPPGDYLLSAYPSDEGLAAVVGRDVRVERGALPRVEIELPPGGSLRIEVVDTDGRPLPRARVEVRDRSDTPYYVSWQPYTDELGVLVVSALPAIDVDVHVRRAGYRPARVAARVTAGASAPVRVVLTPQSK